MIWKRQKEMDNELGISRMKEPLISKVIVLCVLMIGILAWCPNAGLRKGDAGEKTATTVKVEKVSSGKITKWGDAPDFVLPKLGGDKFKLSSLSGKVIILNFWATWCSPCRTEIPDFIDLKKKYGGKGLEIVGVSLDKDGERKVGQFAGKIGINYIIVFGRQEVTDKYGGIRGIPTTFIIDRKGNIVKKYVGFRPLEVFEKDVRELL
ncbi:TlpA family protein disulfide reductase [Candidatus Desantisbacteria bacterium CG07_land_8_20_14_0_80_39_15]|uniref:TlpA family protein disulfide reductase n=2 Tax=unclassified Candidatus Desantisiibacteriota TaxID=3106372 RepID=A0A2H9PC39_9BACT|nr:MAG: TlpA family protein disulfide reductase [Candidatus Desantisbacteria bacterium CG07_land_8_20_14_0_80_39_15]PIZ16627.1 MAG: TlpA family protein disulfide reductase [Candidatus Desantisbacteria bacterium CG_4_10_14_0_8_um_filter_39_17]